jgi:hypothetical protein
MTIKDVIENGQQSIKYGLIIGISSGLLVMAINFSLRQMNIIN